MPAQNIETRAADADVASGFALEIDGAHCCWLLWTSGGGVYADVVAEIGQHRHLSKHVGSPKFRSLEFDLGWPLENRLLSFIADAWKGSAPRLSGSVIAAGGDRRPLAARQFSNALLEEITIPALDVEDHLLHAMRLKVAPERLELVRRPRIELPAHDQIAQLRFQVDNFRLELDGLDCETVARIESFTVRQTVHQHAVGELQGIHQLEAGRVEFPNLTITLLESKHADGWYAWAESFIVHGQNDKSHSKNGKITLFDFDGRHPIAHIGLFEVGICTLANSVAHDATGLQRITVELFCDHMELGGKK
jgi:hypothetical protein